MIEKLLSALAGAIIFAIHQNYYAGRKAVAAFFSSLFMGVIGGEFTSLFLFNYLPEGRDLSMELCSFLTSAFIVPICRGLQERIFKK